MKFPVQAEQLRHIVTIQKRKTDEDGNPERDSSGDPTDAWVNTDAIDIHVFIDPTGGSEYYAAQKINSEANGNIWLRYRTGISSGMRIIYGTRVLDIISPPIDLYEAHRWIRIIWKETE